MLPFLIANHLDGYEFIGFVVQTFQDLPEGAFPNHLQNLKPVGDVVVQHLEEQEDEHREHETTIYIHYTVYWYFYLIIHLRYIT